MTYPAISAANASDVRTDALKYRDTTGTEQEVNQKLAERLRELAEEKIEYKSILIPDGSVDLINAEGAQLKKEWETFCKKETKGSRSIRFEIGASIRIHALLKDLPVEVLSDKDFWRWLSMGPFCWFIVERGLTRLNKKDPEPGENEEVLELVDARFGGRDKSPLYWILIRMYNIGLAVYDPTVKDPYKRIGKLPASSAGGLTDFWHSHIVRIKHWSPKGPFIRKFIDLGAPPLDLKLGQGTELKDRNREFAKGVSRMRAGHAYHLLQEPEHLKDLDKVLGKLFDEANRAFPAESSSSKSS